MNLTSNVKNNLKILLSIALNIDYIDYRKIDITHADMLDSTFMCSFIRNISIGQLEKIKNYFNVDIREKKLHYSLLINKNTNIIKLRIEGIEKFQMNLLDDIEELNNKVKKYNDNITNNLIKLSKYLYETIYPTETEIFNWTFYYISHDKTHIGFANANKESPSSQKILVSNINILNNDDISLFYNTVDTYKGTKNDAIIVCMKRNINSKCGSGWRPCLYGTSLKELWIN